jgi:hypothetical protein
MSQPTESAPADPNAATVMAMSQDLQRMEEVVPHPLVMSALLHAYTQLAVKHRCCTQGAANACFGSAMRLAQAAKLPPQGQPLH